MRFERYYTSDWNEHRQRRKQLLNVFLILLPMVVIAAYLNTFFVQAGLILKFVLIPAWSLALARAYTQYLMFRCPRCHLRYFHLKGKWHLFTKECKHCGLPKWSTDIAPHNEKDSESESTKLP